MRPEEGEEVGVERVEGVEGEEVADIPKEAKDTEAQEKEEVDEEEEDIALDPVLKKNNSEDCLPFKQSLFL